VQQKQAEAAQGTTPSPNLQEPGLNKRPTTQIGGVHKKMKAQRTPPKYTITEDDVEMIARMVQDCISEDFHNAAHHRDIFKRRWKTCYSSSSRSGKHRQQAVAWEKGHQHHKQMKDQKKESAIQSIQYHSSSATFHITPSMLCMYDIVGQTPLKELTQIQLVLPQIPSKALHKLQVSVTQEVQSRARTDLAKLQQATEKRDALEIICEQAKFETQEERERMNGLERKVTATYKKIPKTTQRDELTTTEKID
jgi:hypothetical protein